MKVRNGPPTGDFEIGYGRPPKAHRFQPGKSGNPGGRRKRGNQSLPSAILAELGKPMVYLTKEGPRKALAVQLIARQVVAKAARGDRHSVKSAIDISSKKQNDFVEAENSRQAEIERAASTFDVKFRNALDAIERQADEELEARSDNAQEKKDGAGEG